MQLEEAREQLSQFRYNNNIIYLAFIFYYAMAEKLSLFLWTAFKSLSSLASTINAKIFSCLATEARRPSVKFFPTNMVSLIYAMYNNMYVH